MRRAFCLVLALALIVPLAVSRNRAPADDAPKQAKPVVIPFELLKSKHMAIQVKINGKGPYRMIFDTGAPFTLLSTKAATDSGVINKNTRKPLFTLFGSMGAMTINTFEVGDAKIEKTSAAVMDHPTIEAAAKVLGPLEGLVGFPFFARYAMTIDYQAKTLTLLPSGYPIDDSKDAVESAMMAMLQARPAVRIESPKAVWGFVPRKADDDTGAGVLVDKVYAGSAAAEAGLKPGDRLLTLAGRWTDTPNDTAHAASYVQPGSKAAVVILRDKKEMTLTIAPRRGL